MGPRLLWVLPILGMLTAAVPARAQERAYSYSVVHPLYGTIGTFTESIARSGDTTRIDSHVRVAVRILGIVVHREEADHTEIFRGDRLVSLQSATTTNGTRIDDGFQIFANFLGIFCISAFKIHRERNADSSRYASREVRKQPRGQRIPVGEPERPSNTGA